MGVEASSSGVKNQQYFLWYGNPSKMEITHTTPSVLWVCFTRQTSAATRNSTTSPTSQRRLLTRWSKACWRLLILTNIHRPWSTMLQLPLYTTVCLNPRMQKSHSSPCKIADGRKREREGRIEIQTGWGKGNGKWQPSLWDYKGTIGGCIIMISLSLPSAVLY